MEQKSHEARLELLIVILLGFTAVATAWASWQGSLHGSQQDQKYTNATRLTAEGNSMYNEAADYMSQDMSIWNQIVSLRIDLAFAEDKQDADEIEKIKYKLDTIMADNVGEEFGQAIEQADAQEDYASPFDSDDFINSYFTDANATFDEAETMMEAGDANNTHGDNQGLVTVIYAVVLFLLGIAASFKNEKSKKLLLVMSVIGFVGATAFMLTIPVVLP
jgi:hypothetical protein